MSKKRYAILTLTSLALLAGSFFGGAYAGYENRPEVQRVFSLANKEEGKPAALDFEAFWKTWNVLDDKYIATKGTPKGTTTSETTNDQEKVWGAIRGLTASLGDPYTVFFPPEETKMFQDDINGNFGGVGMEIGVHNQALTVIAPLKGTPAERAGIRSGDKILMVDGKPTGEMTVDQAVRLIRGAKGTSVKLTISRPNQADKEISVTRDIITIPTIDTQKIVSPAGTGATVEAGSVVPKDIFTIRLYNFSAVSPNLFRDALRDFVSSGTNKLILDLRDNPGGFLDASVDMASWFLPAGKVVVREQFGKNHEERVHRSKGYNIFNKNLKLVILVNGGSASASEILAGALQEQGVGMLVGERTFGKGSVQELIPITDDTSLKVTIARWFTPNGNSISENGLKPDVEVKMAKEDIDAHRDPQLAKAIQILNSK
jgi:carboxyl-terminal processing protease